LLDPRVEANAEEIKVCRQGLIKVCQTIESLALDCSEHLEKQHNQKPNDKPRFFFDNIARQTQEVRLKIEKEEAST